MNKLCFGLAAALALAAAPAYAFSVSSPAVGKDTKIPDKYTANTFGCTGSNASLPIVWKTPPKGTKSFAVTLFDLDAPTGSGFWHWTVVNIPPTTMELPEGAGEPGNAKLPMGAVQGRNDTGVAGYLGPCPPQGKPHRYRITVFALKTDKVDVDQNTSGALVGFNVIANRISQASITYTYQRK